MHSDTGTYGGNSYYIHTCRRCGMDKDFCMCWVDFMGMLDRVFAFTLRKEIYKCLIINKKVIQIVNLVRRSLSSISGMKGLKLLERIDKR